MSPARRIHGVVFDAVGTLLLLREPVGRTYARFAAGHGVSLPEARLEEAFRRVLAAASPNVHPGVARSAIPEHERRWWHARVRETFRAADGMVRFDDFAAFFDRLWDHYVRGSAWQLAPGVLPCLDALAARGLALGVLSNFDQRLHGVLAELGLEARFAVITLPADAGAAKPAPAIFDHCLASLGLAAEHVLYVGDRADFDVRAASCAGLRALDVGTLPDLASLPAALDRIEEELAA